MHLMSVLLVVVPYTEATFLNYMYINVRVLDLMCKFYSEKH